jgi:hypothetical protein
MQKKFAVFLMALISLQFNCFAARTAIKQQGVIGGTKITESGTNSLVDSECSDSYFGCMDAFCMVDNVSGGRCQCSNKHTELSKQLNDLLEKDEQAATIAEHGSDLIKMGKAADTVLSDVEKAKTKTQKNESDNKNKTLSRADWDAMFLTQEDDDDEEDFVDMDDISSKHGDALYVAADDMCMEQTPSKCKSSSEMLQMMYVQKIKSDCVAFENSIKQQGSEINVKLADAQRVVRNAALEDLQNANKYNLGECTKEFKSCMQTTAGCKNDFSGCVGLSANQNVNQSLVAIDGDMVSVSIFASTMDVLLSKKILCESVLNNCEKERDNVWNEFLKNSMFEIKSAELNVENNLLTNCVKNISDCYLKSCREHFDVNEEEGTYDMCLSRPENYKSFCKIELEPCLQATGGSYENPGDSRLWNGVLSELAAKRMDACSKEFKACIQDKDRCGEDYSQCIGLDYYDVVDICPTDKLTACYKEYDGNKETVEDTLAILSKGLIGGVESALYDACQKAVSDAMLKYCGNADNCDEFIARDNVGARTLEIKYCENVNGEYTNCKPDVKQILDAELGKTTRNSDLSRTKNERRIFSGVISGKILWDEVTILPDFSGVISGEEYVKIASDLYPMDAKTKEKVKTEVGALSNAIKNTINMIESDPKVQFCMTGRQVSGLTKDDGFEQIIGKEKNKLFPNLTQTVRHQIASGALLAAQKNYNDKFEELVDEYVDSNSRLKQRYAEVDAANKHLNEQDSARRKCIDLGEREGLIQDDYRAKMKEQAGSSSMSDDVVRDHGNDGKLVGWSSESMWNYKLHVTTTFNMEQMICTKCIRKQECDDLRGDYCKRWKDETEECKEYQY